MKPRLVGIEAARATLKDLCAAAARGEEVVITRRGRPIARVVGVEPAQALSIPPRSTAYLRGDIIRDNRDGSDWLVLEDEGTDPGGQVLMRPLGAPLYMTRDGKPGRFRRTARLSASKGGTNELV